MEAPTAVPAPPPISRRTLWLLLATVAAGALAYALYWTPYAVDDAWITYRYAENLAAGNGFVYNLGERVLGTTTPLWTSILALAGSLGLPVPGTSWVIGGVCSILALLLLFQLFRRLHSETAGLLAVVLLTTATLFHQIATYGMETPLYVCLILGAFLAYLTGRESLAAALAALCLLTRLDGAAVGAALFLGHVVIQRRFPWKPALVFLGVAAPWFLFSLAYFGSLTPNSMNAKQLHTDHTILLWMPRWLLMEPRAWLGAVGGLALLAAPATRRGALVPILWAAMYVLAYTLARIHRYPWYQTPVLAVLSGFAAVGAIVMLGFVVRTWRSRRRLPDSLFGIPVRWFVVAGLAGFLLLPDAYRLARRASGDEGVVAIDRARYRMAIWARDSLPAGAPLAVGGIGIIGYFSERHIHDAMGLVSPEVVRLDGPLDDPRAVPYPRFLPAVIEDYDPEYIADGFWLPDGSDMPEFMRGRYEILREWEIDDDDGPRFLLYRRTAPASGGS